MIEITIPGKMVFILKWDPFHVSRKRYVFVVHCPNGPGLDCPMLIDKSGLYVRREGLGGHYICGIGPDSEEVSWVEPLGYK